MLWLAGHPLPQVLKHPVSQLLRSRQLTHFRWMPLWGLKEPHCQVYALPLAQTMSGWCKTMKALLSCVGNISKGCLSSRAQRVWLKPLLQLNCNSSSVVTHSFGVNLQSIPQQISYTCIFISVSDFQICNSSLPIWKVNMHILLTEKLSWGIHSVEIFEHLSKIYIQACSLQHCLYLGIFKCISIWEGLERL